MEDIKKSINQRELDALIHNLTSVKSNDSIHILESSSGVICGEMPLSLSLEKITESAQKVPIINIDFGIDEFNGNNVCDYPNDFLNLLLACFQFNTAIQTSSFEDRLNRLKKLIDSHQVKAVIVSGLEENHSPIRMLHWTNISEIYKICQLIEINLLIACDFEYAKELRIAFNAEQSIKPIFHISEYFECYAYYESVIRQMLQGKNVTKIFIRRLHDYTKGDLIRSDKVIEIINIASLTNSSVEYNSDTMDKYIAL